MRFGKRQRLAHKSAYIEAMLERIDRCLGREYPTYVFELIMNRDGWAALAHALLRARGFINRYDDSQLEAWLFGMLVGTDSNWWFDEYDPYEGYKEHLADLAELGLDDDGYTEYLQ